MDEIEWMTLKLAQACDGIPVTSTMVIILFYLAFVLLESTVEELLTGSRFTHWLDPFVICLFILRAAYAVYWCALWYTAKVSL